MGQGGPGLCCSGVLSENGETWLRGWYVFRSRFPGPIVHLVGWQRVVAVVTWLEIVVEPAHGPHTVVKAIHIDSIAVPFAGVLHKSAGSFGGELDSSVEHQGLAGVNPRVGGAAQQQQGGLALCGVS